MPRFDRTDAAAGPLVRGFDGTRFVVDGERFNAVLLTPDQALGWTPPALADLAAADVEPVLATAPAPEFLLFGSGAALVRPPRAFVAALEARGIGVEVMDSRAAARTWAVLRAEERWIAAAFMPLV